MKVCDLTQFYSPVSGGVKRYLQEKGAYMAMERPGDRHIWIIPGETTSVVTNGASVVYSIKSPLVSRTSRYRFLWRLDLVEEILERETPDTIEAGDPYQMAWKATTSARALGLSSIGFYHSHFPEAYVRSFMKYLGKLPTEMLMEFSRSYVANLYNRFDRTIVPSAPLGAVLNAWGVGNIEVIELGVDTARFSPDPVRGQAMRASLGIGVEDRVLLYVGRLAPEKNVGVLFKAYTNLLEQDWSSWLIIVGDGKERSAVHELRDKTQRVLWMPYCEDTDMLADLYRAADVFVHPGVQETFGLVTLESQACGTPVVGIRGSYMDRIIFTNLDHWAEANTADALCESIKAMWDQDLNELGRVAAASVGERYSWKRVFRRLFEVYETVNELRHFR